ncbi:MAG: hypothetical protein H0X66_04790 [Verrucomicrobia bacterium]|nr:hypothetical protein [Verrucomicrobiota bacterium]
MDHRTDKLPAERQLKVAEGFNRFQPTDQEAVADPSRGVTPRIVAVRGTLDLSRIYPAAISQT